MIVYQGIVKGNTVLLPEGVQLEEGAVVEVRVYDITPVSAEERAREDQFKQLLLEQGVITRIATPTPFPPEEDRTPIVVLGEPLSEQIIRERR